MSEPALKELLERLKKIDAVVSHIAIELAEQRAEIKELFERVAMLGKSVLAERACSEALHKLANRTRDDLDMLGDAHVHQWADMVSRVSALEDKVFPNMGRMLHRMEKVVGAFSGWHFSNPLDRRGKDIG